MLTWRSLVAFWLVVSLGGAGCASPTEMHADGPIVDKKLAALVRHPCEDGFEDVYERPDDLAQGDQGDQDDQDDRDDQGDKSDKSDKSDKDKQNLKDRRGEIVRCARGDAISTDALRAALEEAGFVDVDVKSPVQLYRVMYRTRRASSEADVSSALVVVPSAKVQSAKVQKDGAYSLRSNSDDEGEGVGPMVVYGHGTSPYRQDCGVSRSDPLTATFLGEPDRELRTVLALAAQGWPVIMPDYAGFVEGSSVTGYMFAEDEAYSVLDATRALHELLDQAPEQAVLVGHSQGGHAVLSAQAYAKHYGSAGELAGVVAFAPFWAPARAFGVIIWPDSGYTTDDPTGAGGYALNTAVEYFYTHAELIDGPGHGQQILGLNIHDLIGSPGAECNYFPDLTPYGITGQDLFIDAFAAVGVCAATGQACDEPLAQTWSARFQEDRPALDPKGAPVLLWQGAQDTVVPLSIAGCGIDKIGADFAVPQASATFKLCADANAEHELVESNNAAHVISWINSRVFGAGEPSQACGEQSLLEGLDCFIGNHD